MKLFFIISFLIASISVSAVEFMIDGITVQSITIEKKVQCEGYSIRLFQEKFPSKYEMRIPKKFRIVQYQGADFIIKKEAYIMPKNAKIPLPNDLNNIKNILLPKRTFLPYTAVCKKNTFVIFYESGGNCEGCEAFVEFDVIDGNPTNPRNINYMTIKQIYE